MCDKKTLALREIRDRAHAVDPFGPCWPLAEAISLLCDAALREEGMGARAGHNPLLVQAAAYLLLLLDDPNARLSVTDDFVEPLRALVEPLLPPKPPTLEEALDVLRQVVSQTGERPFAVARALLARVR